jgi:hypothetical protein
MTKKSRQRTCTNLLFCFAGTLVITACTLEQPKQPVPTVTHTATVTPTPILTVTPAPTYTPPITPTQDPPNIERPKPPSDIRNPEWSYGVFKSDVKTPSGSYEGSYILKREPVFDKQNKQVEWIVEYSIPLTENATSVEIQVKESLVKIELANGFKAQFIDNSGVTLGTENLDEEGQGNTRRYTLRIPNNIWARWSEVAIVKILKGKYISK